MRVNLKLKTTMAKTIYKFIKSSIHMDTIEIHTHTHFKARLTIDFYLFEISAYEKSIEMCAYGYMIHTHTFSGVNH